jgi:hypothetical protein
MASEYMKRLERQFENEVADELRRRVAACSDPNCDLCVEAKALLEPVTSAPPSEVAGGELATFTIKPLEWAQREPTRFAENVYISEPLRVNYTIARNTGGHWHWQSSVSDPVLVDSLEEGKRLAEKHWQEYISTALTVATLDPATAIQVVEGMRDKWKYGCESHAREDPYREYCRQSMMAANEILTALRAGQPLAGDAEWSIARTALLGVLKRLRSKHKSPNQWYEGWNAALDCLVHDLNAATSIPAGVPEVKCAELVNVRS